MQGLSFPDLAAKYPDDIAIVWIDAHPDINLPNDSYEGNTMLWLLLLVWEWEMKR